MHCCSISRCIFVQQLLFCVCHHLQNFLYFVVFVGTRFIGFFERVWFMMNSNNSNGRQRGRYSYQPQNFPTIPAYQPYATVSSVEEFAREMLNVVSGGKTDKKHKEFLTKKLNEIGQIVYNKNNRMPITSDDRLCLLMAETWALNYTVSSKSTFSVFGYYCCFCLRVFISSFRFWLLLLFFFVFWAQ